MELGRENQKDNDLFFTSALIDYISRKTKLTRKTVCQCSGRNSVWKKNL